MAEMINNVNFDNFHQNIYHYLAHPNNSLKSCLYSDLDEMLGVSDEDVADYDEEEKLYDRLNVDESLYYKLNDKRKKHMRYA